METAELSLCAAAASPNAEKACAQPRSAKVELDVWRALMKAGRVTHVRSKNWCGVAQLHAFDRRERVQLLASINDGEEAYRIVVECGIPVDGPLANLPTEGEGPWTATIAELLRFVPDPKTSDNHAAANLVQEAL